MIGGVQFERLAEGVDGSDPGAVRLVGQTQTAIGVGCGGVSLDCLEARFNHRLHGRIKSALWLFQLGAFRRFFEGHALLALIAAAQEWGSHEECDGGNSHGGIAYSG